jgi:aldose 1-epimerase
MQAITIADGRSEAVIIPRLGAGLARYDFLASGGRQPLFRPCPDPERAGPFDLAHNLLVPWSGRISGGGFSVEDHFYPLAPNWPGEPLPIHGNGFSSPWEVEEQEERRAVCRLVSGGPGPYAYEGRVTYALEEGALAIELAVTNRAPAALPYGLGLHPWFPRTPGTTLHAPAALVTLEDHLHLPAGQIPVSARKDWDFSTPRRLPGAWINNDFSPWNGRAEIAWADRGLALAVDTRGDPHLKAYILYSPASDADFFCFEPVTHPVDAHNRGGGRQKHGLVSLAPGETLAIGCCFAPRQL